MWLFDALSDLFYRAYLVIWWMADVAEEIWVVGDQIASSFRDFADELYDISVKFKELSYWADGIETQIRDLLTWDSIRAEIEERFPIVTWSPLDIVDNIWDTFVAKLEGWLEERTDWVYRVGEKVLLKLLDHEIGTK